MADASSKSIEEEFRGGVSWQPHNKEARWETTDEDHYGRMRENNPKQGSKRKQTSTNTGFQTGLIAAQLLTICIPAIFAACLLP